MPECPPDLTELQFASLMFEQTCQVRYNIILGVNTFSSRTIRHVVLGRTRSTIHFELGFAARASEKSTLWACIDAMDLFSFSVQSGTKIMKRHSIFVSYLDIFTLVPRSSLRKVLLYVTWDYTCLLPFVVRISQQLFKPATSSLVYRWRWWRDDEQATKCLLCPRNIDGNPAISRSGRERDVPQTICRTPADPSLSDDGRKFVFTGYMPGSEIIW